MTTTGTDQRRPSMSRNQSTPLGYLSMPFEKFRESDFPDFSSPFTLLDTIETFFDSRFDLLERRVKQRADRLIAKAEDVIRTPSGEIPYSKELTNFKLKVADRMQKLTTSWQSAKVVRTREKVAFFFGVMNVLSVGLLFGVAPQWIHIVYTLQSAYLLPIRVYTYKKKSWHYFLFDVCYYSNILNFIYLWIAPSSPSLFVACYCLAHGSLASAVITWRNSLVFHDPEKITSLFIHIYPPFVFTVIRHFYPDASTRFPALKEIPHLHPIRALLLSAVIYSIWQGLYWKFVLVDRKHKIDSGQRTTSFSFLLNDKRGVIGRLLSWVPPNYRLFSFMVGQLVYALVTELPAVYILYDSPFWSCVFLIFIFGVSVWNGGGFYIEVFGRKFERQLEALRKELAEATAAAASSGPPSQFSPTASEYASSDANSPVINGRGNNLPDTPTIISALALDSVDADIGSKKNQ